MPTETDRVVGRKRIYPADAFGSDTQYVDIPVITEITLRADGSDQYWETTYKLKNTSESNRKVHIDDVEQYSVDNYVTDDNGNTYYVGRVLSSTNPLEVERIDEWPIKLDGSEQYWQRNHKIDNVTGNDLTPPHFSKHFKTHIVRYKNPNNDNIWVDIELIDELHVRHDGSEQYWQYTLKIKHPQETFSGDALVCDSSLPDVSDSNLDPPYRLDPFQNIINQNFGDGKRWWSFRYVMMDFSGVIDVDNSRFESGADFPSSYTNVSANVAFINIQQDTQPDVPPAPSTDSAYIGGDTGYTIAGLPPSQPYDASGYNIFPDNGSVGPYFVTVNTILVPVGGGATVPGPSSTFDFSGVTLTNPVENPDVTWTIAGYSSSSEFRTGAASYGFIRVYFKPSGPS